VSAHLEHQPVKARRPSFGYVARKFVRRHRAAVAVAGAIALLVAAGLVAILWQARVAERERARAQRRFDEVRQLAHFVIFDLHDGVAKLPGATELRRQMIERSLAYLDSLASEAAGDPRLQLELAEAYSRLGDVLGRRDVANLGDRAGALASFGKARDQLRRAVAARPHDAAAQRALAGVLIKLHGAVDLPEEKKALLDESMGIWEGLAQADASEDNLYGLASAHFAAHIGANEGPSAIPHMERSLAIFQQLLAARPGDPVRQRNVALCHKYLGGSLAQLDPQRAVVHMQEAARLDGARLAAEPRNPQAKLDYTFDLSAIAFFHLVRREYAQALPMFEETLRLRREILAGDPADVQARERLADTLMRIGGVHALTGRYDIARGFLQEGLGLLRGQPEDQKTIALTLSCLYLLMAEVTYVEKGDACAWYRRLPAQIERVRKVGLEARFEGPFASLMERATGRIESCAAQGGPAG
jgi:eukaryotic-like serine/threonine-protein kinase